MNSAEGLEFGRLIAEGFAQGLEQGEGMLRFANAMPTSLYGIPLREDRTTLRPGQGMLVRAHHGGDELVLHPTTHNAMVLAAHLGDIERMHDPRVMIAASIRWQQDEIARKAKRAEQHLDLVMAQQDVRRAREAQAVTLRDELWQAMMDAHPGEEHAWRLDALRDVLACRVCGSRVTAEMAVRLGIEIPRGPQLQVLIDDEWHDVGGIRNLSFTREDGAR